MVHLLSYGIGYSKFIEESCFTPYAFGILSIRKRCIIARFVATNFS